MTPENEEPAVGHGWLADGLLHRVLDTLSIDGDLGDSSRPLVERIMLLGGRGQMAVTERDRLRAEVERLTGARADVADLYHRAVQIGSLVTCRAEQEDALTVGAKVEQAVVEALLHALNVAEDQTVTETVAALRAEVERLRDEVAGVHVLLDDAGDPDSHITEYVDLSLRDRVAALIRRAECAEAEIGLAQAELGLAQADVSDYEAALDGVRAAEVQRLRADVADRRLMSGAGIPTSREDEELIDAFIEIQVCGRDLHDETEVVPPPADRRLLAAANRMLSERLDIQRATIEEMRGERAMRKELIARLRGQIAAASNDARYERDRAADLRRQMQRALDELPQECAAAEVLDEALHADDVVDSDREPRSDYITASEAIDAAERIAADNAAAADDLHRRLMMVAEHRDDALNEAARLREILEHGETTGIRIAIEDHDGRMHMVVTGPREQEQHVLRVATETWRATMELIASVARDQAVKAGALAERAEVERLRDTLQRVRELSQDDDWQDDHSESTELLVAGALLRAQEAEIERDQARAELEGVRFALDNGADEDAWPPGSTAQAVARLRGSRDVLRAEVERLRRRVVRAEADLAGVHVLLRILAEPGTWASGDAMPDGHPYDPRETCGCRGPAACRDRRARGECSRMVRAPEEVSDG